MAKKLQIFVALLVSLACIAYVLKGSTTRVKSQPNISVKVSLTDESFIIQSTSQLEDILANADVTD